MDRLGFDVIDARRQDIVEAVMERTGQRGADCIVEASGLPITFLQALKSAAVFGQVVLLGDMAADVTLEAFAAFNIYPT